MTSSSNIRVLVAEDSPTARALLVGMLSSASGLEVIGEATNGIDAVEMTKRLHPDVVTMDIQMPGLDGFEATKRIMSEMPTPIVIVSSLDVHSVQFSIEALNAGALAVLPKPVGPSSPSYEQASRFIAATVRSMAQVKLVRRWPSAPPYKPPTIGSPIASRNASGPSVRPRIVTIAASTGGPAALHKLFAELAADFPLPILVVQHIALGFAEGFAKWLDDATPLRVRVARAGDPLRPGNVYLAADDRHLGVSERSTILLSEGPSVGSFRPSGTFLFESASRVFGPATLGIILTGMGSDGVAGLRTLKAGGGKVIAQDEATSTIFGMPGAAVAEGLADMVLPLPMIAAQLRWLVGQ
jgi:two-component system, chemotaxis family, protein-glutamate methylesterase/glutaminase